MNRTDRLVAMVTYLQGRRVVKAEELAEHFEVTVRTVYRDVSALSESGVPVCGEPGVGYSLVKGYHLPPVMLTAEEAMALFVGGEMVKQFADASLSGPMATALLKLRSVLPRDSQDDLDRLAATTSIHGVGREKGLPDRKTLLPVQQAVVSRRVLRMRYRAKARDKDEWRDVEPLGITYHSDAWYLIAWCRLRSDYRNFRLDRLSQLEVLKERFAPRADFDLKEYLARQMSSAERTPVRVWFAKEVMERVRLESYVSIQHEASRDGGFDVAMATYSIDWFARWLLSFGAKAQALEPEALVETVRRHAEEVAARYGASV